MSGIPRKDYGFRDEEKKFTLADGIDRTISVSLETNHLSTESFL